MLSRHKVLFNLWFASSGGAYQATNPAIPFWPVLGPYKMREGLFPLCFASNPLNSIFNGVRVAKLLQSSPRLAHKVQKCNRVDEEEESREYPQTGSELFLPLDH